MSRRLFQIEIHLIDALVAIYLVKFHQNLVLLLLLLLLLSLNWQLKYLKLKRNAKNVKRSNYFVDCSNLKRFLNFPIYFVNKFVEIVPQEIKLNFAFLKFNKSRAAVFLVVKNSVDKGKKVKNLLINEIKGGN